MEVDSLRTFRYCKMSGMDIKRRTLRKRRPTKKDNKWGWIGWEKYKDIYNVEGWDTYPGSMEKDADKHGRDGEVVDETSDFEHEVEFVRRRHKLETFTV